MSTDHFVREKAAQALLASAKQSLQANQLLPCLIALEGLSLLITSEKHPLYREMLTLATNLTRRAASQDKQKTQEEDIECFLS